jgi:flavin reductase (DIM6/NTAB) family NADH-FMN oxidoreductase RutF
VTAAAFSQPPPDTARLRSVLGQFATGVTVVAAGGKIPCGMTANAFTSVSLDPPLILICLTRNSELCEAVLREGCFAVSVLAAHQEDLARYFANHARPRGPEEFAKVGWSPGPGTGAPVLDDAVAWLDCVVTTSHDGGDHEIFLGSVLASGAEPQRDALLFFRGGFCRSPHDAVPRSHEARTPSLARLGKSDDRPQ